MLLFHALSLAAINLHVAPTATVTLATVAALITEESNPAAGPKEWSAPAALVTGFGDTAAEARAAAPNESLTWMGTAAAPTVPPPLLLECAQKARCDRYVGVAGLDQVACAAHCSLYFQITLFAHAAAGPFRCQCIGACAAVLVDGRFSVYTSAAECPVLPQPRPAAWQKHPAFDGPLMLESAASTPPKQPVQRDCARYPQACAPPPAVVRTPSVAERASSRRGWWGSWARMSRGQRLLCACNLALCLCFTGLGVAWLLAAWNRRVSAAQLPMLIHSARAALHSPPPLAIVLPVKGVHTRAADNWRTQLTQHGYSGKVSFVFVVQEATDPAYILCAATLAFSLLLVSTLQPDPLASLQRPSTSPRPRRLAPVHRPASLMPTWLLIVPPPPSISKEQADAHLACVPHCSVPVPPPPAG
jgi:hypothetical protein